jgi:hypothetical protein
MDEGSNLNNEIIQKHKFEFRKLEVQVLGADKFVVDRTNNNHKTRIFEDIGDDKKATGRPKQDRLSIDINNNHKGKPKVKLRRKKQETTSISSEVSEVLKENGKVEEPEPQTVLVHQYNLSRVNYYWPLF